MKKFDINRHLELYDLNEKLKKGLQNGDTMTSGNIKLNVFDALQLQHKVEEELTK